jgi:MYXO-CTERM domain-containing protein
VTAASFTLSGGVTGTITFNSPANTVATFTPSAALADNTTYTATLTSAITDVAGNALATNYVWSFTTGTTPVVVVSTGGGGGGCAVSPSGAGNEGIIGTYGFLALVALGIALRRRARGRKE